MTEKEYIQLSNRIKLTTALGILRDILPGEDCGIRIDDINKATAILRKAEEKLFSMVEASE